MGEGGAFTERVDAAGDAAVGRQADVLASRAVKLQYGLRRAAAATADVSIVGTCVRHNHH